MRFYTTLKTHLFHSDEFKVKYGKGAYLTYCLMYTVTKEIHFCYGHRLIHYEGKCRNLHGHNARAQVELHSESLDKRGMVYDFHDIGRVMKTWIDDVLDHKLLLHQDDPIIPDLKAKKEVFYTMPINPTAEALAKLIYDYAVSQKFPVHSVTVWETESSFATYKK